MKQQTWRYVKAAIIGASFGGPFGYYVMGPFLMSVL